MARGRHACPETPKRLGCGVNPALSAVVSLWVYGEEVESISRDYPAGGQPHHGNADESKTSSPANMEVIFEAALENYLNKDFNDIKEGGITKGVVVRSA